MSESTSRWRAPHSKSIARSTMSWIEQPTTAICAPPRVFTAFRAAQISRFWISTLCAPLNSNTQSIVGIVTRQRLGSLPTGGMR